MRYRDQNGQDWADIIELPDDVAGSLSSPDPAFRPPPLLSKRALDGRIGAMSGDLSPL
jgi:hypothetical protein